jgi:N-acetylmuramoyl-L-alanine amidase
MKGKSYRLPILIHEFNGMSIRSTLGMNDWDRAVAIQQYNGKLFENGVKPGRYTEDLELWVPVHLNDCHFQKNADSPSIAGKGETIEVPLFGEAYKKVELKDEVLKGHVYYLISGHGGPDPGAMGEHNSHTLCEDEYAYDVTIRLARNLMEHGAIVHMIIRDENDGIRDDEYLKPDKDEVCLNEGDLPLNQLKRLKQRVRAVNKLYESYRKRNDIILQRAISVHVDSRHEEKKIDLFFYHYPGSEKGKSMAEMMLQTVKNEYAEHQKGREYKGVVRSRDLYVLREIKPVMIYIELGNITNAFDQKRLLVVNNRQALANWFKEGIINHQGKP